MRKSKKSALVWLKCCILVLSVNFFAHIKTKGLERKIAPISRKLSKTFNNLSSSLQSTYSKQQHDSTEDGSVHCKMAVIPDNSYIIMLKENSSEADLEAVISLLKSKPFNGKVESEFKALKGFSVVLDEAVTSKVINVCGI